eukprot:TRINITY_DN23970_c0_g2_i1.p1 TRINITY_DN23970_c0_g2~~TRINITY_DN23970_c0_g2_i1.p1  ORF type:complete len:428 (-),score=123.15 TRINITY_DN23970_c0_g2_i1:379-1662(-)
MVVKTAGVQVVASAGPGSLGCRLSAQVAASSGSGSSYSSHARPSPGASSSSSSSSSSAAASASAHPEDGHERMGGGDGQQQRMDEHGVLQAHPIHYNGAPLPGFCKIPLHKPGGTPFRVSVFQHMGDRKTQEDRFVVAPSLPTVSRHSLCSFFGVFDGTVGDFASENIRKLAIPKLLEAAQRHQVDEALRSGGLAASKEKVLDAMTREMYKSMDGALLDRCSQEGNQHYATCTSVTLFMAHDTIAIGHLGDSRIALGKINENGELVGEQMTYDHKPDLETERARIESCGGMVERLQNHNHKPFIRGGDFLMRKALGEQPMQLQYSRAFGAKDLKIFGLSNVPDVKILRLGSPGYRRCKVAILASDGLWDVLTAQQAVQAACGALDEGFEPAEAIVKLVVMEQKRRKARADNITAVCIFFDEQQQMFA